MSEKRPYDWTGNPDAKANRQRKAETVVEHCKTNDIDPRVLVATRDRNRVMREAGGYIEIDGKRKPRWPSASDETWDLVVTLYARWFDATWLQRELSRPPRGA